MTPIAVIGIDCRFPDAPDKEAFWRLMMDGVVTDTEIPPQRWDVESYYDVDGTAGSMNTRRAHFIDDVDAFDNEFFGISPIEAAALDPQQRLLLQSAWRAVEDAGINPRSLAGTPTGVFVGMMASEWGNIQLLDFPHLTALRGAGSGYFMAANRISYHLNLTGPSMAIDSACSSSLMAVHQGCAALHSGESDTVIAAGTNLILVPALSIFYTQAGLSAPDGRCKPFGRGADGIGRGEGVAAVVLRRLDDAVAAGQPIYAVVKSSVANHDGRSNGITAPSRRSQVGLMRRALRLAEVEAERIAFIEAHGTGTVLGDMIESKALGDIHKIRAGEPCLLGSVKGNIGHTEGSAGIAAFIKVCLALHYHLLPPTVFGDSENPDLQLGAQGLRLADVPQVLPPNGALGAVSSFGLGGSNAHAILESAPDVGLPGPGTTGVLTLSAPSLEALRRNIDSTHVALDNCGSQQIASWCRTTNLVKRSHRHRFALMGTRATLLGGLQEFRAGARPELVSSAPVRKVPARVGLLFAGQGTQYPGMTLPLYENNPIYREHLEVAAAALTPHLPVNLLAAIFGDESSLDSTGLAQPALFALSYALGKTLLQSALHPSFGIGHSVGEVAAACLAGVLSVDDAARLVAVRARLMDSLPVGGAMIACELSLDEAEIVLAEESACSLAAINGPRSVVISGRTDAVARAMATIRGRGARAVHLKVTHAFHSPLMEPIVAEFRREVAGLEPGPSSFPLFSTVLGKRVDGHEMDADYWASQICSPVRFFEAVSASLTEAEADYVTEAGPRTTLLTLARQCGLPPQIESLALCGGPDSDGTELLEVAATLLRDGYSPDLTPLYGQPAGTLHRLPPYVFDTSSRFWFEGSVEAVVPPAPPAPVEPERLARDSTRDALLAVIADVGGYPVAQIDPSSRLGDDLGYDSLVQLRLLNRLQNQYRELESLRAVEVLPHMHSVGTLVAFLLLRLGETDLDENGLDENGFDENGRA